VKKLAYATAALFVLLVGAILVGPSFIDWNQYKTEITAQAFEMTGRELIVDGDISLSLLPSPSLEVNKVRLANLAGGEAQEMVTLRSAVVNVALGPLIGGQIRVESVRLNDPVINLEVLKDGSKNWEFDAPEENGEPASKESGEDEGGANESPSDIPIQIDAFRVVNGTIVYRDQVSGTVERIDGLSAQIVAGSLIGPFDASGSLVRKGLPLDYEVSLGKIIHGRTVGFAASVGLGGKGKAKFSGTLVDAEDGMRIKGDIKAQGANLADLIGALAGGGEYPGLLGQAFDASGGLSVSEKGIEVPDLMVALGKTKARVAANVTFGDLLGAGVAVAIKQIDLDDWIKRPTIVAKGMVRGEQVAVIDKTDDGPRASMSLTPKAETKKPVKSKDQPFAIPKNINAAVDLSVEALSFRGGAIKDAKVSLEVTGGEVTLNQASAQLPGGSDVAAFGFIDVNQGEPKFEGSLEASANDLRGVLRWLKVAQPQVSADRLRKLNMKSEIVATATQLDLKDAKIVLDSSTITGGATIALINRPSFGATLTVDRLNLDSYLMSGAKGAAPAKAAAAKPGKKTKASAKKSTPLPAALQGLKALTGFDANVKLLVKALTAKGAVARNARLDANLYQGNLTLTRLGADNLAGASIKVSGKLNKLGGIPEAKNLSVDLSAKDTARLFELVKIASPISPKQLGAVNIKARVDGSLLTPKVDAILKAMGGTFEVSGKLSPFDLLSGLKAQVSVNHGNLAGLMRALNLDYRPSGRNIKIALSGSAFSKDGAIALTNIDGTIAGSPVSGQVAVAENKGRKGLVAELALGDFVLDPLLPGEPKTAQGGRTASRSGVSGRSRTGASAPKERWSKKPLDLTALKSFDADVKVKAKSLTYGKYRVDNADATLVLANGLLTLSPLKGVVFGGQFDATARLNAAAVPAFNGVLTLRGSDVRRGTRAVTGKDMASGTLSVSSQVSAAGESVYGLVSSLNGQGDFALNRIDVNAKQASGTAIAGVLNLVKALNGLGGGKGKGLADVTGSYQMTNGVARSNNMKLVSGVASGGAKGLVDLPAWQTDVSGEVNMAKSTLGIVLKLAKVKVPDRVPFTVKGPLDNPKVVLLKGQGSTGTTTGAPPDPRAPVQPQSQQQKQNTGGGVLNQLLKGVLR